MRPLCNVLLAGLAGLSFATGAAAAAPADINQQLADRLAAVRQEYQAAYRLVVERVNRQFGIDYAALDHDYQALYNAYRQKLVLVEKIDDPERRGAMKARLEEFFKNPACVRYAEARLVIENELERDHLLQARCLQAYEEILDQLIASDPLLRHFFQSAGYRNAYGLLLKRMVWELGGGESASTAPLNVYAVFANQAQTPYLIKVSPVACESLSFLRSILIHELNHVLLNKEAFLAGLDLSASPQARTPTQPVTSQYSLFFNQKHGGTATYQYALIHEYYSFKAQLLYDDQAPADAQYRLSLEARRHIESLCDWAYSELSPASKAFVQAHPAPPMEAYVQLIALPALAGTPPIEHP